MEGADNPNSINKSGGGEGGLLNSAINSVTAMNNNIKAHHHHHHHHHTNHVQQNGNGTNNGGPGGRHLGEKKPIRLVSPAGAPPMFWQWSEKDTSNIGSEVLEIIRLAVFHFPVLEEPLRTKLGNVDVTNYDQVRSLAKKFNKAMNATTQTRKESLSKVQPKELLHQIITRCYNRAVDNEKALNKHYSAFSSQTYGETSYQRMQMIIDELKPSEKDVFVDLGSGVGQLVVQIAGATSVQRAIGIEIAQLPSRFARKLETEFKKCMHWFGRPYRPFELKEGDFLVTEWRKLITEEATIIFINNYAFQSDLETRIKRELLSDLRDGTRIISTKPYVPLNKQGAITDRQLNDISVITEIVEMKPCPNPCSWTSNHVPYYLHTINRAKLERYFLTLRNSSLRAKSSDTGSRRSSTPNSKASNSRESSVGPRDKSSENGNGNVKMNGDDISFGPTTRRRWNDYVKELDMQKKKRTQHGGGGGPRRAPTCSGTSSADNASTPATTPAPTGPSPSAAKSILQMESVTAARSCSFSSNSASADANSTAAALGQRDRSLSLTAAAATISPSATGNGSIVPAATAIVAAAGVVVGTTSNAAGDWSMSPKFEPLSPIKTGSLPSAASTPLAPPQIGAQKRTTTKRTYERKEKGVAGAATSSGTRGRPRKADKLNSGGGHQHTSPKVPRLSDDARDGMELMHQMTCAVQAGKPADAATILADMANQKAVRRLSTSGMDISSPPFPNKDNPPGSSTNGSQNDRNGPQYAGRYPGLNKFMDGFRSLYENWFDEFYTNREEHHHHQAGSQHQPLTAPTTQPLVKEEPKTVFEEREQQPPPQRTPVVAAEVHFRSILDQTPVKRFPATTVATEESGGSSSNGTGINGGGEGRPRLQSEGGTPTGRVAELQRRIQEQKRRVREKWVELQQEVDRLNTDMDTLVAECRQHQEAFSQQQQHQQSQLQQSQQQHQQQIQQQLVQQQQQQQLIAAAQAQLAAAVAAQQSAAVLQQQNQQQAAVAAVASNQLELLINEVREQYSRQLTAQQLLTQITQLGLLNSIAPQEIAALQSIASGAALNGVVHQMSPVAAAAAAAVLHSPAAQQPRPQPGPSPAVQNFLSSLDNSVATGAATAMSTGGSASISANVSAVAAELAHTAASHGINSASANVQHVGGGGAHHPPASLSLHQVSQNFPSSSCPGGGGGVGHHQSQPVPTSSTANSLLTRESTVAEVVAEVAALPSTVPRKPFRPRPARNSGAGKRNTQNAQKQQQNVEDPKKQAEIERQIQDIVAKALEVDSQAKSAEKDRKARGGEKRTKDKIPIACTASSQMVVPTTSSTMAALDKQQHQHGQQSTRALPNSIEFQVKADSAIMQNFLTAAVVASQHKQQQQQQQGGGTVLVNNSCNLPHPPSTPMLDGKRTPSLSANDFRLAGLVASTPGIVPQSPSLHQQQQQHFTFTPSSVSLAIQGSAVGCSIPQPTTAVFSTPLHHQTTAPKLGTAAAMGGGFLHAGESCSPPFISLNLPPSTTAGLVGPPPTNVVVKVESKIPPGPLP